MNQIRRPDPHFGTDEQMLAWCKEKNITPTKDRHGDWDWFTAWAEYEARLESDKTKDKP